MKIHCLYDALVSPSELKPHPKNRNKHPDEQIRRLADILDYQGWRYPIKVSRLSGFITSGHGRLMAAKMLGLQEVPVNYQEYESETQEYADLQADNAIALWAELDFSGINADIGDFGPDFDIDLLGIKDFTIDVAEKVEEDKYTPSTESPIYEPTGENPKVSTLYDLKKTMELLTELANSTFLPSEIKMFLEFASYRHIIFDYQKIAEFYAHAPSNIRNLMENSALVIIDFNKAIEKGFVKLTEDLAEAYDQ